MTGLNIHGPFQYEQDTDPGAVGAGLYWLNTLTFGINRRNLTNTSWVQVGATGPTGAQGPTGDTGPIGPLGLPGLVSATVTGSQPYMCFQDQKPSGTSGGTFTSGSWQTRTLNAVMSNDMNIAVLSSNQITLPAGTYRVFIAVPAFFVVNHKARLRSITLGNTLLVGTSETAQATGGTATKSIIAGKIALTSTQVLEVQHQCQTTSSGTGFGQASSFGELEIYTVAEFTLVGGPPPFFGSTGPTELPSFEKVRRQSRAATY